MNKIVFAALLMLMANSDVSAHGDIHERIDALSEDVNHSAGDIEKLIRRGQLYLESGHSEEALDDFTLALKQDPQRNEIHFYIAQTQLAMKNSDKAFARVNIFLQNADSNAPRARGLLLRGDIYAKEKKLDEAAIDYTQVVAQKKLEALPDDYVRVADTYLAADAKNAALALDWLNRGIEKLGSLAVLEERALNIEISEKRYPDAIARIDRLIEQKNRLYYFYYKKGDIFAMQGDDYNAKKMYAQALEAINTLPASRKNTPALLQLKQDIEKRNTD